MTIKEARHGAGMTPKEVSLFLEIPVRTLQAWEAGTRVPPPYVEKLVVEKLQNVEDCEDMSRKTDEIHEVYLQCKEIFEPSLELQDEIFNIQDAEDEEKMFYELLTNFFMQQRQKELVEKGVF